ncbi:hypothetical protein WICMUC_005261 [Wickerhamomyces mucosus]|uniref:Coatomer subunit epsilon n=1 Tax=Wickerhamomyces mucosus TaxID=1378264 RepID=A0A9P8T6I7_9ASCO|nr:hypothetical protein WICMUC_005261 [Wickerhamomyces mucosus]
MAENDGRYEQVASSSINEYFDDIKLHAKDYKIRSLIILGEFEEASKIISKESNQEFQKTYQYYLQFTQSQSKSPINEFDSLIETNKSLWFIQTIGALYLVGTGRIDVAIELLTNHENNLESVLLLIELYLFQNKLSLAETELKSASAYSHDNVIYNFAEAFINTYKNGEDLRGPLYFYEELSHQYPSYKTLLGQLILNLQLKQFEEADVALDQLKQLEGINEDLLANEITVNAIKGSDSTEIKQHLENLNPNHPVLVDLNEKNSLFDNIVAKYAEQIQN